MKKLSVSELAKLYGYSRQAIGKYINVAVASYSQRSDGLIDFSEALRVFGEPQKKEDTVNQSQSINSQNLTEVDLLKRQVDILEKQLNQAIQRENQSLERESFYQEQIEAMQRLLEAPKANMTTFTDQSFKQDIATDPRSELATNYDELTTPQQDSIKRIPIPEKLNFSEQKKRGFQAAFSFHMVRPRLQFFEEPISVQALEIMTPQKTG
ncbi:plasmid replication DNA-binding protein [Klebsiella pneumoniae]|uniref:plasmid replication DNA-binding protein n=1 Tax=Klebsiella pneumoniae TaxID=573 RepID=UPI00403B2454